MKSIYKIRAGLMSLSFLFLVLILPISLAIPVNNQDTVLVSNLSEGTTIEFIFNNGLPVFAKADNQGEAKYLALSDGDIEVIALQDGNIINSSNYTVDIIHPTPSQHVGAGAREGGSGTGTDCGGVVDQEPLTNIVASQMKDNSIFVNSTAKYSFNNSDLSIYELTLTNDIDIPCLSIKVERLKETSKNVGGSNPPGTIYANENIVSDKNVRSVNVRFKVENSWLTSKGIDKTNVVLYKFSGSWNPLETDLITDDSTYTYYEAKNTGFESFAIGSKGVSTGPISTIVPTSAETTTPSTTVTTTKAKPISTQKTPGFEFMVAVFTVSVLYIFKRIKK